VALPSAVQDLVLAVDGVALSAAVLEEFLALGGRDECHVFDSYVGRTRSGPFASNTGRAAAARRRTQFIDAAAAGIEIATAVTAALRWRGQCASMLQ
jgi:hypothetical protein